MCLQSTEAIGVVYDTVHTCDDRNYYSTHVLKRADEFLPPLNQPLESLFSQVPQQESDYTETPHHYNNHMHIVSETTRGLSLNSLIL